MTTRKILWRVYPGMEVSLYYSVRQFGENRFKGSNRCYNKPNKTFFPLLHFAINVSSLLFSRKFAGRIKAIPSTDPYYCCKACIRTCRFTRTGMSLHCWMATPDSTSKAICESPKLDQRPGLPTDKKDICLVDNMELWQTSNWMLTLSAIMQSNILNCFWNERELNCFKKKTLKMYFFLS